MKKLVILSKAKYIKRWKGKDGKWQYKYPGDPKSSASNKEIKGIGKYLYHGTNEDVLDNIIERGLTPGRRGQLSFSKTEEYAQSFATEGMTPKGKTRGIMFRVKSDILNNKLTLKRVDGKDRPLSDQKHEVLTKETVPVEQLEISYDNGNTWNSLAYEASVRKMEDFCLKFYGNKSEVAVSLDATGKVLTESYGKQTFVQFSSEELEKLQGARVLIHNHPLGGSFSYADVTVGIVHGIQEMRVVDNNYTYSYTPKPVAIRDAQHKKEIKDVIFGYWEDARNKHIDRVRNMVTENKITKEQADDLFQHAVMGEFAKMYGGTYTRKKR